MSRSFARIVVMLLLASAPVSALAQPATVVDWGGGFIRRGDNSSATSVATSGAGTPATPPLAAAAPPAPRGAVVDWGGGFVRVGDNSSAATPATAGASGPEPAKSPR